MSTTTVDELQVLITAQSNRFHSEISKVQQQIKALDRTAQGISSSIPRSFGRAGTAAVAMGSIITAGAVAAFRALSSTAGDAIARLDTLNNYPRVMASLGYRVEEAQKSIRRLSDGVLGLPTALDQIVDVTQQIATSSKTLALATERALALNNMLLAGGKGQEVANSAMDQFNSMLSTGKADMMRWQALVRAAPGQMKQLAQSMLGSSANAMHLQQAIMSGKISMQQFANEIVKLNIHGLAGFGSFRQQAEAATGGVGTAIQNMRTALVRGLAEIMNAIGQSNIAAFFNGITRAINAVIPYVVAVVKVIATAVGYISSLLGGGAKSVKSIGTAAAGAAGAVGDVASGAEDVGGALGGANKEAKKLKGTLASFDEMNVLQKPEAAPSSGGGGGGGGGGGDVDIPDFGDLTSGLDGLKSKADEIAEAIKKVFTNFFSGFDFEKIGNAFKQLWQDAQMFIQPVGMILGDLWSSYLKPLIYWTGNQLLPAFLNALGGALAFVGQMMGAFWTIALKPLIDDFLVPIARWTGGLIVKTLNNIGNGLRSLANNEKAIRILVGTITSLGAAFTGIKIAAFILEVSKAVAIFGTLRGAGLGVTGVLAAISGNTVGVTSSMAGVGTTISGLVANSVAPARAAFSSLWGIMSAHPILALITIIGALLLTNENFRAALMNLMQSALTPLMNLFSTLVGAIQPLMTVLISLLTIVLTPIIGVIQILAEVLAVVFNAVSPLIEAFVTLAVTTSPVFIALQALVPLLELLSAGLSKFSGWVTGLIEKLPFFSKKTDENSSAMGKNKQEVEKARQAMNDHERQIDKNKDGVLQYTEIIDGLSDALAAQSSDELALMRAKEQQAEATKKASDLAKKYGMTMDEATQKLREGTLKQHDLKKALLENDVATGRVNDANRRLSQSSGQLQSHANKLKEEYDKTIRKMDEYSRGSTANQKAFDEQKKKAGELSERIKSLGKNVGEMKNYKSISYQGGQAIGQGAIDGLSSKTPNWLNINRSFALQGTQAFKDAAKIHSPSKLYASYGKFIGQGAVDGVKGMFKPFRKVNEQLASIGADAFNGMRLADIGNLHLNSSLVTDLGDQLSAELEAQPVHVTVKVGEDTLVNKIVEGINDRGFMSNSNVLVV